MKKMLAKGTNLIFISFILLSILSLVFVIFSQADSKKGASLTLTERASTKNTQASPAIENQKSSSQNGSINEPSPPVLSGSNSIESSARTSQEEITDKKSSNNQIGKNEDVVKKIEKPMNEVSDANENESNSIKTLRNFYRLLSSDTEYKKAYEKLDESFIIKMGLFAQCGVKELKKSDMDLENFPIYADLFKAINLERIVKESIEKNNSTIYYYQTYSLGESNGVRIPMVVTLKKVNKKWMLTSMGDGDANAEPFKITFNHNFY